MERVTDSLSKRKGSQYVQKLIVTEQANKYWVVGNVKDWLNNVKGWLNNKPIITNQPNLMFQAYLVLQQGKREPLNKIMPTAFIMLDNGLNIIVRPDPEPFELVWVSLDE